LPKTFKSEGIIFRCLKYSETSLIMDIYTQEYGLGSYIVSGVRKAKSSTLNVYRPMNIIDLVAYMPGESLARVKEATHAVHYDQLDRDVIRASIGTFFVDLLKNSIKEKERNDALYAYMRETLVALDSATQLANLPILFCLQLSVHLGFQVMDNYNAEYRFFDLQVGQYIQTAESSKYALNDMLSEALHNLMQDPQAKLDKLSRRLLLDAMMNYYKYHIEGFTDLRSLPVLRSILS